MVFVRYRWQRYYEKKEEDVMKFGDIKALMSSDYAKKGHLCQPHLFKLIKKYA